MKKYLWMLSAAVMIGALKGLRNIKDKKKWQARLRNICDMQQVGKQ